MRWPVGMAVTGSHPSNDDLRRLVHLAHTKWGRADVLVDSAGHGPRGPILDIADEVWDHGLDVHLMNFIRALRCDMPAMQGQ